ncbi:hypothetical protein, partial [Ralstonia sp.]|uniref:hypothetical protein n=1 Tax=Ralstonia sp. TaxID=54061 RepID=UPI00257B44EA
GSAPPPAPSAVVNRPSSPWYGLNFAELVPFPLVIFQRRATLLFYSSIGGPLTLESPSGIPAEK